jgi:cytidine deaminase
MYEKDIRNDEEMKRLLIETAIGKLPNSYAPYSHYNVAAAALFDSGKIYTGVNVESASLGMTLCAERNAIFHAVAEGERKLLAVAIVGGQDGERSEYCVPCGACRQVMRDFGDKDSMIVISARTPDDYLEKTLDEMLPYSFGPESLD